MKKTILIIALAAFSAVTFAQAKKDTVKADQNLCINLDKPRAELILKGMQIAYKATSESVSISAADGTKAEGSTAYFIGLIYKKWPELMPKQVKQ